MSYTIVGRLRRWMQKAIIALVFAQILGGGATFARAQQTPPDPSGIATGDKSAVVDAAGNPLVVPEPTDKTAPDYPQNKKAFDDFQAQAAKEPIALHLADSVGHMRVATNFSWTLLTGYLVLFMQAGFHCSPAAWCERRTPDIS